MVVPADHLSRPAYQYFIWTLAASAVVALFIQFFIQSSEDYKRGQREKERDDRDRRIEIFLNKNAPVQQPVAAQQVTEDQLDVEMYFSFLYPKAGDLAFNILEARHVANGGKASDVTTDCDFLAELYIVNKSNEAIYIKDFAAWIEDKGQWQRLRRDENFDLDDLWSGSVEYGLETNEKRGDFPEEPKQLESLIARIGSRINPREPIHGWLKFTAKDVNPKLAYPAKLAVIDSIGREHHVDRTVLQKREIGLRRVRR